MMTEEHVHTWNGTPFAELSLQELQAAVHDAVLTWEWIHTPTLGFVARPESFERKMRERLACLEQEVFVRSIELWHPH